VDRNLDSNVDRYVVKSRANGEFTIGRAVYMTHRAPSLRRAFCLGLAALALASVTLSSVSAQQFDVKPIAEKKISQLPAGPLYWRIELFSTLTQAETAAGSTALAAEVAGKVWMFTLGPMGGSSPGGTKVAEIGPVPPVAAPEYLLRINVSGGPPGGKTPVHTHPGSETFYVLAGELTQKTPHGTSHVSAGQSMAGHEPGLPMEVSSSGTSNLTALVMFIVDATKPFSSSTVMP
jgi:quercetin dioxygenase-like cupin family protein